MTILKTFSEHKSGGAKLEDRPVFTSCIEYCLANSVKYLLVSEVSRLGRSTLQILRAIEQLNESKVSVYIQNLNIYTLLENGEINPLASIILVLLGEFAAQERLLIAGRLSSGRKRYIEKGGKVGRPKGSLANQEREQEKYKTVIALLKKGVSHKTIAQITGISPTTVQRIKNKYLNTK